MNKSIFTMLLLGCNTPIGVKSGDTGSFAGGGSGAQPGQTCDEGGVFDCDLECWVTEARDYIGDGTCDEGERGPNFDCIDMSADEGDCDTDDGSGDTTGGGGVGGGVGGDTTGGGTTGGGTTGGGTTGGGTTGGGTADGGTSGGGGGTGIGADCVIEDGLTLVDETGTPVLEIPPGYPGYYDCNLLCIPTEFIDGVPAEGFPSWIGDAYCDDDEGAPEGSWAPDLNCAEYDFDGGDCA